jgi:hypothetical protein
MFMEIYIQSRGHSPDFEYCWQPSVPDELSRVSSLIQSDSPSVVLARFHKRLMLLVTGLVSPQKKDFRERPIRHSVVWFLDEDYDGEAQIRAITVRALQGLLADQVDEHIQFGGESGFEASIPGIEKMSRSFLSQNEIGILPLPSSELNSKIGKDS